MADSGQAQPVTYQMVTLTSQLAETIIKDDSPQTVMSEIWEFMNTELMTANLTYIDFQNIMDFVDLRFANMLLGIPEDLWNDVSIKETVWDKDENGKLFMAVTKVYNIVELWDNVRAKVYIKCCNSRDGHLLKALTTQRSETKGFYEERGTQNPLAGEQQKSRWRLI
ncbi:MAG: hypothetical protein NTU57_02620 [Candidatus Aenigmarchaeota archaeon]|nr:hypothetical protein [Candidatus Aenigmarchaeota archaeon]